MTDVNWLTGDQLVRLIRKNANLPTQVSFLGVFAVDTLPLYISKLPVLLIVNSDTSNLPGQHWRAIFIENTQHGEVFDSLAMPVSHLLEKWMNINTVKWTASTTIIQHSFFQSCGAFVVHYVLHRLSERNMEDYTKKHFSVNKERNEICIRNYIHGLKK